MVSLAELSPAERAQLLSKPVGELGIALGESMNSTNAKIIDAVYSRLRPQPGNRILEIGSGNGKLLPRLMQQADTLSYVGIDISETMVAEATLFNRALIDAGAATFRLASAEAIPYPEESFNRALAINVVYFWTDPVQALTEIRRVLRPSGFSIIAGIDGPTATAAPFTREEFGFRVRDADALIALHREAGFASVDVESFDEQVKRPDGTPWARHYNLIIAQP
jgi:ubiquinone/menaquinone biosynthesis C-methylase UbiE